MSSHAVDGLDVERVLDELISRLVRSEQTKGARAALIEARRLRGLTARWSAIPPPDDARREMLARVLDLVAMTSGKPVTEGSATASGAHRAIRRALPTPLPSKGDADEEGRVAPAATAGPRASFADIPYLGDLAKDPSVPPPPSSAPPPPSPSTPRAPRTSEPGEGRPPLPGPRLAAPPPPPRRAQSGAMPIVLPPPPLSEPGPGAPRDSRPASRESSMPRLPSRPPPPAPFPSAPPPAAASPGQGRTLRAPIAPGITLVRPDAAPWRPFPKVPDITLKLLFRNPQQGIYTALLRLDAGAALPSHRHAATEEMYIVEGVAMIGEIEMCAGDYCRSEPGSVHERIRTAVGCTILLTGSERDEVFDGPPKSEP
jgi:hypothetical protein